ncbi:MAG: Uncharacterized protein K0S27_743 [Gammaproteobacteria bacterium]|jgi:hypothetical protein|nr:Uncharacterized protein [Gammaproteobacteria bacterium]
MNIISLNKINNILLKKIIILFWAVWWLIALWTDVTGGLAYIHLIHASWASPNNYVALVESLKMYQVPSWLPPLFFICILGGSLLSTLAFCWAIIALRKNKSIWIKRAAIAFIISLTYWLTFFLADQAVMKFDIEENHMVQGGFQLLSFLALYLLPD